MSGRNKNDRKKRSRGCEEKGVCVLLDINGSSRIPGVGALVDHISLLMNKFEGEGKAIVISKNTDYYW
jgi:hypothetical protein